MIMPEYQFKIGDLVKLSEDNIFSAYNKLPIWYSDELYEIINLTYSIPSFTPQQLLKYPVAHLNKNLKVSQIIHDGNQISTHFLKLSIKDIRKEKLIKINNEKQL